MKKLTIPFLLVASILTSCSKSTEKDPTPKPSDDDYSACEYVLHYNLQYSPLKANSPVNVLYLNSKQEEETVALSDTTFNLTVDYKYGDSVYVRFDKKVIYFTNNTGNKVHYSYRIENKSTGTTCPIFISSGESNSSFNRDSLPSGAFIVSGKKIVKQD